MTTTLAPGFGELRSLLHHRPTAEAFTSLCLTLRHWRGEELQHRVLPYVRGLVSQWPEESRTLRGQAAITLLEDETDHPMLQLVHRLDLGELDLPSPAIKRLLRSSQLGSLRRLSLRHNRIGSGGLCDLIERDLFPQLIELDLRHNAIRDRGLEALASVSARNKLALRTLLLGGNPVRERGLGSFLRAPVLDRLEVLDLSSVGLDDDRLLLLQQLPRHHKLRYLDLRHNAITDRGARRLAEMPRMLGLRELYLEHNFISATGAEALHRSPYLCEELQQRWGQRLFELRERR